MATLVLAAAMMVCVGGLLAVRLLADRPRVILVVIVPGGGYGQAGRGYTYRPGRAMLRLGAG